LGRRKQEFKGSLQILCQPQYLPKLQNLHSLNLYDCAISNLDSIGIFGDCPSLEILNLGRNPLTSLPDELAQVTSLKQVWLDDCKITGSLPTSLLELPNLEILRMPNNSITEVTNDISKLQNLKVLCLDRNQLTDLPDLSEMSQLKELLVRHNQLKKLPCLPLSLQLLHVSSNQLVELTMDCPALTHVYANGNQLTRLPANILTPEIKRLVVSHNPITEVPDWFWTATCDIVWQPNPNLTPPVGDVEMTPAKE
jgi:Leucine-rich repeat (LRR) protein